jgi:arylsulfatase
VRLEFAYDGGGIARGGSLSLFVDGAKVGEGRVEQTEPFVFSADETCDIGFDSASPVCPDYRTGALRGEVNWVEFDVGEAADDADHVIDPSERLRIALALQ